MWQYRGQKRPDFAAVPAQGQESVWDYPRPPKLLPDGRLVEVYYGDQAVAWSRETCRVIETASPPSFYIPPKDVNWEILSFSAGRSICEWKGVAKYRTLSSDPKVGVVGWSYSDPTPAFVQIVGF